MQYGNISQLSAGTKYGSQRTDVTEPYNAESFLGFGKAAFGYKGNPDAAVDVFTDSNTMTYSTAFILDNVIAFTVQGVAIDPVTFTDDHATTMELLVAAIQVLDPDYIVSYVGNVVTVVTPGEVIVITSAVTLGVTQPTSTPGTPAVSGDLVFLGAVIKAQKAPVVDADNLGYAIDEELEVMRSGYLTVVVDDIANCRENTPVYVIVTGTDKGKFTGTSGSNLLINADFHFLADKAQNLAVVNFEQLPKSVA